MNKTPTLIFVYRADRGFFNTISHTMHRIFSPETYECRFCQFTSSAFGMLRPWKDFLGSRPEAKIFYHRRGFEAAYPDVTSELPLILRDYSTGSQPEILLDRSDIEKCRDLNDLIEKLERALEQSEMGGSPASGSGSNRSMNRPAGFSSSAFYEENPGA